jgi:hypothetical protein
LLAVPMLTAAVAVTASGASAQAPSPSAPSSTTTEPVGQPAVPPSESSADDTSPPASQEAGESPADENRQRVTVDDALDEILRRGLEPASSVPAATSASPGTSSDAWRLGAAAAGGAAPALCARRIRRRRQSPVVGGEGAEAAVSESATSPPAATAEIPVTMQTGLDGDHGESLDGAVVMGAPPPGLGDGAVAMAPDSDIAPGPGDVGVWVAVLGTVEVTGLPSEIGDRHKLTEVLVYLATHGERPVRAEALLCACWPDRDIASTTFNSVMSRLRRHLSTDDAGQRRLPAADGGAYQLGPDVGCDWMSFRALVARAKAADPSTAVTAYREALSLVRGEPFATVGRGTYSWAWSEQLVYEMEGAVVQAAVALGELALNEGDTETARWAAVRGRVASPCEPLLFEIQIRAAAEAGDEGELARLREAAGGGRRL